MRENEIAAKFDFLVSIAIVGLPPTLESVQELSKLSARLQARFQFWEVLLVIPLSENLDERVREGFGTIPNLRILRASDSDSFYRLRLAGASEAIGDVVVLTSAAEMPLIDICAVAIETYRCGNVVVVSKDKRPLVRPIIEMFLGYLSGYHIDTRDTSTAGFPRGRLSALLTRPDAELLLRFDLRSGSNRFARMRVANFPRGTRPFKSVGRRLRLLLDLASNAGPRVLRAVAMMSLCVALASPLYVVYAFGVWAFKAEIEPGWLTTTISQAGIAGFLGIALSALSIGMVKILDRLDGIMSYTIVEELNNIDFFNEIRELNIDHGKTLHSSGETE